MRFGRKNVPLRFELITDSGWLTLWIPQRVLKQQQQQQLHGKNHLTTSCAHWPKRTRAATITRNQFLFEGFFLFSLGLCVTFTEMCSHRVRCLPNYNAHHHTEIFWTRHTQKTGGAHGNKWLMTIVVFLAPLIICLSLDSLDSNYIFEIQFFVSVHIRTFNKFLSLL